MKTLKKIIIVLLVAVALAAVLGSKNVDLSNNNHAIPQTLSKQDSEPILQGPYNVVRVVDGDTIVVRIGNEETKVRFIGVDTPESVHSDTSRNTPEGKIASDWTKQLLENTAVYLEYDLQTTDKYGRHLAYVYTADKRMVQEMLLEEGMASVMTIQPNSKYAKRFAELQKQAAESGVGFWK